MTAYEKAIVLERAAWGAYKGAVLGGSPMSLLLKLGADWKVLYGERMTLRPAWLA